MQCNVGRAVCVSAMCSVMCRGVCALQYVQCIYCIAVCSLQYVQSNAISNSPHSWLIFSSRIGHVLLSWEILPPKILAEKYCQSFTIIRVWQNSSWQNRVDRHVVDRIRVDRISTWQNRSWQNKYLTESELTEKVLDRIPTWQNFLLILWSFTKFYEVL